MSYCAFSSFLAHKHVLRVFAPHPCPDIWILFTINNRMCNIQFPSLLDRNKLAIHQTLQVTRRLYCAAQSLQDCSLIVWGRAWPMLHLADCSDGRLSRLWEQPMLRPMLSVTDCLPNKPNVAIWLWTQLYQGCAITPTGYVNGNWFYQLGTG